jgi:hypothetical protein
MKELSQGIHRFEAREVLPQIRLVFLALLGFILAVCILLCLCFHGDQDLFEFVISLGVIYPICILAVYLIIWIALGNIVYEISSASIIKKRGEKTVCSVAISDVQSFMEKNIITLKVSGRKNFLFRDVGKKSSRKRLLTVLRELGLKEVAREKIKPIQVIIIIVALICITHYLQSLVMWGIFTDRCLKWNEVGIDWPMFLHAIPAIVFLIMSGVTVWFACKRKRGRFVLPGLVLIGSISCFYIEHNHDFYQWETGEYCTWWWYGLFEKNEEAEFGDFPAFSHTYYKYGYVDTEGNIVIDLKFDFAEGFSEGLACVGYRIKKEDADQDVLKRQSWRFDPDYQAWPLPFPKPDDRVQSFGFINRKGCVVIEPQFDGADDFSNGMARIYMRRKYGYINTSGEIVIEPQYDYQAERFSDGFAVVCVKEKYIFIDKQGKAAFPGQYDRAERFSEGLAGVRIDGKWGFIDRTGQVVIKPRFGFVRNFSEGLAVVELNDKWGYINEIGELIIEPLFDNATGFHDGIGKVRVDGAWGLTEPWGCIDRSGRFTLEPRFCFPPRFFGELGRVCYAKGWGYRQKYWSEWIDKTGKTVNRPYYDKAYSFSDGLTEVEIDDKIGFINQSGKLIVKPQFDTAGSFSEGLAFVGLKTKETEK